MEGYSEAIELGEWLNTWANELHIMSGVSRETLLVKLFTVVGIDEQTNCAISAQGQQEKQCDFLTKWAR